MTTKRRQCKCCGAKLCARCGRRAPVGPWSQICSDCGKSWNPWTPAELRLLRAAYANHHVRGLPAAIAEHVNHAAESVSQRATKLGLTKMRDGRGRARAGVCDVCGGSTKNNPVLEVRDLDLYLLCRSCNNRLHPTTGNQTRRTNAARG